MYDARGCIVLSTGIGEARLTLHNKMLSRGGSAAWLVGCNVAAAAAAVVGLGFKNRIKKKTFNIDHISIF